MPLENIRNWEGEKEKPRTRDFVTKLIGRVKHKRRGKYKPEPTARRLNSDYSEVTIPV
jgi:hypothetical protein